MGAAALMTDREVTRRLKAYMQGRGGGVWRSGAAVRDRPRQRLDRCAVGATRAAPARRVVRDRDLQAAAQRHRLLDHQAAGHPGAELRTGRRQLRVSHGTRHARAAFAANVARHRGEHKFASLAAFDRVDITTRTRPSRRPTSMSAGPPPSPTDRSSAWYCRPRALVRRRRLGEDDGRAIRMAGLARWLLTVGLVDRGVNRRGAGDDRRRPGRCERPREVYHPWYAQPDRLFVLLLAVGVTAGWGMSRPDDGCPSARMGCAIRSWRGRSHCRSGSRSPVAALWLAARRRISVDAAAADGGRPAR